ncbi:MAG: hypothetical protein KAV87_10310, partial [Desulfobacteraceae bacterium]|nr:hypothetical protein [Desulfobacteraceae bacterium]
QVHRIANEIRESTDRPTLNKLDEMLKKKQVKMEPQEFPPIITKEGKKVRRRLYEVPPRKHETWAIFIPYLKYVPKVEFSFEDDQVLYGHSIDLVEPEIVRSLRRQLKPIARVVLFIIGLIVALSVYEIFKLFKFYL